MFIRRPFPAVACLIGALLLCAARAASAQEPDWADARDLVAVGIVDEGQAIVLATPGLPSGGRIWRFRSLDTSGIPQPISDVVLAAAGTKLLIQADTGPGGVLDLTRQLRHNMPLQYVSPDDLAPGGGARAHTHRLPGQRFVSIADGDATVIDDIGLLLPDYPVVRAVSGAISDDGAVLYLRDDGSLLVCGESASIRSACRELPDRVSTAPARVQARSYRGGDDDVPPPRFLLLADVGHAAAVIGLGQDGQAGKPMRRAEAALRACLMLHGLAMPDARIAAYLDALIRESAETLAAGGRPITDWRFFRVAPDQELYAPVLGFAPLETVFPARFDILEALAGRASAAPARKADVERLYDKYLRLDLRARQEQCTLYHRTHSTPGSWMIEYWIYYPFDVGGFVSHPHDPEHIFVEVDKLGGAPRRVIGAGHGYFAGNNVYTSDKPGARPLTLPLFAIVELGKHASAPDVDRDGHFVPGVDENEYRERAKVWGVRDVIGTINNQLLAYDSTMSVPRRSEDALALVSGPARFPGGLHPEVRASCRLEPMPAGETRAARSWARVSDWIILTPCRTLTADCAHRFVTEHPDYLDVRTILKEWAFPASFLRASYGAGPRRSLQTVGLGYAMDLDRVPGIGRFLPLPGRLGIDGFYWRQDPNEPDLDSCIGKDDQDGCHRKQGGGWAIRYEQFLSNLFGVFSAVRVYSPPSLADTWITFGPFVEVPLGRRSNLNVQAGLATRPYESPRFDIRVSAGLWKPKTNHVGLHAGPDGRR